MIGFPGLGIEFPLNPDIFKIGGFSLKWYGLILAAGFLLAVMYCLRKSPKFGLRQEDFIDTVFAAIPAGIIGARLYYVAFNWYAEGYASDPLRIFKIWEGGMAIYGGIIAAVITAVLFSRVRRISAGAILDAGAPGLLIGQAVGRWGNFFNGEVYGRETTLPWRMLVPSGETVHPLFLYESLWNAVGLVLLLLLMKKRKYNGQLFTVYVAWYGLGRGFLEGMRSAEFNLMFDKFKVSQVLAFLSFAAAILLLFYMSVFRKHPPILAWTAERDAYLKRKSDKKANISEAPEETGTPETDSAGEDRGGNQE